jgi:hypothetical protein
MAITSDHIFDRCSDGNHQWPHIWHVFWWQSPVTTYLTGVLIAITSDHIFDRCSDGNRQCPHIWQVFWWQSPVTTYLTGVLVAMTRDHIFDRCSDGNDQWPHIWLIIFYHLNREFLIHFNFHKFLKNITIIQTILLGIIFFFMIGLS